MTTMPETGPERPSDVLLDEIEDRIRFALNLSMDSCARCKTCDKQVEAVMAVIEDEAINRMAEQFVAESRMRALEIRDGKVHLDTMPAREIVAQWVGAARTMIGDAENYIEMDVSFAGLSEGYTFHLSRRGKLTPHQARKIAEARADEARQLVEEALHLRQNGEYAPGGKENRPDWDRKAETWLRGQ